MTVAEMLKLLPGGAEFPDARAEESVENLDDRAEEKRLRGSRQGPLETRFESTVSALAYVALFSDENLARQIVPAGSQWGTALAEAGFLGPDGRIRVPVPRVIETMENTRWFAFRDALGGLPTIHEIKERDITRRKRPVL